MPYFIEVHGYQEKVPEYLLAYKKDNDNTPSSSEKSNYDDSSQKEENSGTLKLDAICILVNIRYSQDISLLNEAREKLEVILIIIGLENITIT